MGNTPKETVTGLSLNTRLKALSAMSFGTSRLRQMCASSAARIKSALTNIGYATMWHSFINLMNKIKLWFEPKNYHPIGACDSTPNFTDLDILSSETAVRATVMEVSE